MDKMDIYMIRVSGGRMLLCIGSEDGIKRLSNLKHDYNMSKVVDFLIDNHIYCNMCCEKEDDVFLLDEDLDRLINNGLLVSPELAFSATVLKKKDEIYNNLEYIHELIGVSKEDIDDIFVNSWWLDKFEF